MTDISDIIPKIDSYFDEHCFQLDRETIYEMNKQDSGAINNVIAFLEPHCYGIQVYDEINFDYMIFYINNEDGLKGLGLELSLKMNLDIRTLYTIEFSKLLVCNYPHIDLVETFNTFQTQARSIFEKLNFHTMGNEVLSHIQDRSCSIIVAGKRGVIKFPTMEKVELYRWFFNENKDVVYVDNSKIKKIYLLLDSKNNLIKIGQSYYPDLREKTLQGISPKWDLITTWIAPVAEELALHKMFQEKRIRGEWFKLNFSDLQKIKEYMNKYKLNS